MNTLHTRSPSPIARVADAARELAWSIRHLAEHAFGRVGHRIGAWRCASRIRSAERDIRDMEFMLELARDDIKKVPESIKRHELFIAGLRARMDQHKALS